MKRRQPEFEQKTHKCGCFTAGAMQMCPLHAAAPGLLKALVVAEATLRDLAERAADDAEWDRGGNAWVAWNGARDAIAKAGGARVVMDATGTRWE